MTTDSSFQIIMRNTAHNSPNLWEVGKAFHFGSLAILEALMGRQGSQCPCAFSSVLFGFMTAWPKLESFGKRVSQLRKCLQNTGLQAVCRAFYWLMTDGGRPSSPSMVSNLNGPELCKKAWQANQKQARKKPDSVAFASFSTCPDFFLSDRVWPKSCNMN